MHNCLMFIIYKMLRHKRTTFCDQVPAFSTETPISNGGFVYSSHDVSTEDNDTGEKVRIPEGTEIKVVRICNPGATDTTVFFGECLARSEWFLTLSQRSAYSSCTCRFSIGGVRMDAPITPGTGKIRPQWGASRIACTVNRITNSFCCKLSWRSCQMPQKTTDGRWVGFWSNHSIVHVFLNNHLHLKFRTHVHLHTFYRYDDQF